MPSFSPPTTPSYMSNLPTAEIQHQQYWLGRRQGLCDVRAPRLNTLVGPIEGPLSFVLSPGPAGGYSVRKFVTSLSISLVGAFRALMCSNTSATIVGNHLLESQDLSFHYQIGGVD